MMTDPNARLVVLTACNPAHEDYTSSDGDDVEDVDDAPGSPDPAFQRPLNPPELVDAGPVCAETSEPVEFRTTHDYRTDARWRYASGAVCRHRIIR